ncbi:hypothetical protein [Aquibaculum sediminis]|uniref:hypothetical protein n=1 Tax=Aquibaculum sediminis TaxID=3231907 RepID=UPI0034555FE4
MSNKLNKTISNKIHTEKEPNPVFDFLYHDVRRVASFLSQFNDAGHLTGVTVGDINEEAKHTHGSIKASGSIPGLAKANGSYGENENSRNSHEHTRVYDPIWSNARSFLNYLDSHNLIERDFENARIGQFFLTSGKLEITDLDMIRRSMDLPSIKRIFKTMQPNAHKNRSMRRSSKEDASDNQTAHNRDIAFELLTILPHALLGRIFANNGQAVWSTLDRPSLLTNSEYLLLKHGSSISGKWNMLGIIDAIPGAYGDIDNDSDSLYGMNSAHNQGQELFVSVFNSIIPLSKRFLGRPESYHGMTPLLIYREVSG